MKNGVRELPSPQPFGGRFSSIDEVLTVYRPVMRAVASAVGPHCEVVLHDLSRDNLDMGSTIVAIENGNVTGREVGGPSTNLGFGVISNQSSDHDAFGYRGLTSDGRQLSCSSLYFHDYDGRIIAALCINVDFSAVQRARDMLNVLLTAEVPMVQPKPSEFIGQDLASVLNFMIAQAIADVGKPVGSMTREDRIAVLAQLDAQGAMQMRKAVDSIAARLGISRVTVYSYLDEAHSRIGATRA
jgi:predicted transcriptional regulator YheO